jgi:hypothetical protein
MAFLGAGDAITHPVNGAYFQGRVTAPSTPSNVILPALENKNEHKNLGVFLPPPDNPLLAREGAA